MSRLGKKITLDAVADELGMSKRTVRRMISSGDLPAYLIGKRCVRVDSDDLAAVCKPIVPNHRD